MIALKIILITITAYCMGNINFAVIISRHLNSDIRKAGSGNPGTVNMARTFGAKWGALTLLLDAVKGGVPALGAYWLMGCDTLGLYTAGFAAMAGHMFPIVYRFKGGKGVATAIGVYFAVNPLVATIAFLAAMLYLVFFHYGFICSMIFITAMTTVELFWGEPSAICEPARLAMAALIFVMIVIAHQKNFRRLLMGCENKLYIFKKKNQPKNQ